MSLFFPGVEPEFHSNNCNERYVELAHIRLCRMMSSREYSYDAGVCYTSLIIVS